ncbi:MAG: HpcH/HpaI aldolase/citrate lyase family protein [Halopenitus sp.]
MKLADKLAADRPVGGWCSVPSPTVAEVMANQAFDFLAVDTEHAPTTTESVENLVRAVDAAPGETEAIVRVAWNDHVRIKRVLDTGISGVMAPRIESAEEARELVRACRYPPQGDAAEGPTGEAVDSDGVRGRRGVAAARASDYGARIDEVVRTVNDDLAVIAQIETGAAVDAAAEIAAVPGIDALFVGPADLSASLGCFREFDDPEFEAAISDTLAAGEATGVPVGTLATSDERIDDWLDAGFDFLIAGTDAGFLANGASRVIDRYEEHVDRDEES